MKLQNELIAKFMGSKYINTPFKAVKDDTILTDFWHWTKPDIGFPVDQSGIELSTCFMIANFKYHKSWDWLMPVIQKIENLSVAGMEEISSGELADVDWSFSVEINDNQCVIHRYCSPQYYGEDSDFLKLYNCRNKNRNKILIVYRSVIKFIKWYNKQTSACYC